MKNLKTTLTGIGTTIFTILGILAALPYTLGDISTILPSQHKETIFVVSASAAAALKIWNSIVSKDA